MPHLSTQTTEKILKLINLKSNGLNERRPSARDEAHARPPKHFYRKYQVREYTVLKHNCFELINKPDVSTHIIYFHGGGYKKQASTVTWRFAEKFLKQYPCMVTCVDYPLAPEYQCTDTVNMALQATKHIQSNNPDKKIVLLGDSAGAGLALVIAQQLAKDKASKQPDKIVLLSPWLNVSMTAPISKQLDKNDLILNIEHLHASGIAYAGKLDTKDPLCSPLYGDSKDVGPIALFIGTKDILHVDALNFKSKAEIDGYDLSYYEYEEMQHDFALLPVMQAETAINEMIAFIKK
ncbi:MAG: alpha/beta hydrolase [Clostridiales bacterium]|nr:alpha/beta hydrolase [Clostridiales bacterium]